MSKIDEIQKNTKNYINNLANPELVVDIDSFGDKQQVYFVDLKDVSNEDLESYVSLAGAWLSYLNMKVTEVDSKRSALSMLFEAEQDKAIARLVAKYEEEGKKKPTQAELKGLALIHNSSLNNAMLELASLTATFKEIEGTKQSWQQFYWTVGKVISLRGLGNAN